MILVNDVLKSKGSEVWTVTVQTPVKDALNLLTDKNIGAVPVLKEDGKISGMFTEREYTWACAHDNKLCLDCPVSEVMIEEAVVVNPTMTVDHCMAIMTDKRVRHLLVADDGDISGIISIGDVVKSVISEKDILIDQLEHYIEGSM